MPTLRELIEAAKAKAVVPPPAPSILAQKIEAQKAEAQTAQKAQTAPQETPPLSRLEQLRAAAASASLNAATLKGEAPSPTSPTSPTSHSPVTRTHVPLVPLVEAPPPVEDFPEGDIAAFKADIAYMEANMENRELLGQVVRKTMMQWKSNPQFTSLLTEQDEDTIMAAMRRAFNLAALKKSDEREKRNTKKLERSEIDDLMAGVDLGFGGKK